MRPRPLLFLLLAAVPAFSQEARPPAAPPEIAVTVQLAAGPEIIAPWHTFVADVANRTTRELDLVLRIEDDSYLAVAVRRERLSAGARKRLFLYSSGAPYPRGGPPRFRIRDASGRDLAEGIIPTSSRGYGTHLYQVGLLTRAYSSGDDFGIPSSLNSQEIRIGKLSPATLPDRWIGLAALDLLLIHDAALDELTTDQARALSEYVQQGGTIVLSPGPAKGWLSHPVLATIATIQSDEPRLVPLLPGLNALHGAFRRADPFLVHPLLNGELLNPTLRGEIARFPSGFGRVYALSFDLLRAPFDTWNGRRGLWADLLAASPRWFQEDRSSFPAAASVRQRMELFQQMSRLINPYPSFGLILALAVLFLLAVGPVNYAILWRLRRTILIVVTVPAISIGFLGFILALGYSLKGSTTVVHSARLLSTRSGFNRARELHLYSLFSPSTRNYDIAFEPGSYGQPSQRWVQNDDRYAYGRRNETMTALTCETGPGLTLRGLETGQWQSWSLETRALRDLGKGVRFEADGALLKIANGSSRSIERGIYIQTGPEATVAPFGGIGPGASIEAPLAGPKTSPLQALGLPPDSLGERLLRNWFGTIFIRTPQPQGAVERPQRFLVCILRDDPASVTVDARVSDRSRSITLLHIGEAP